MNERVTLELDAEILAAAREAGLDLSDLLSRALRRQLPQCAPSNEEKRWLEDNKQAIDSINSFIDRYGLLANSLRFRTPPA